MIWKLEFLPETLDDLASLDNSIRQPVIKGIKKGVFKVFEGLFI